MKLTRILYLSDYEVIAYQANAKLKTLEIVQRFAKNTEGYDDFKHYLQQDVKTPIFWLVDTSYEEYRIAQIPHVLGKDRKSVLAHRMKRLFEYTSYTYAQVQGRETSGRGDDIVLFTALNQINLLQPWLNDILEYKIPLRGIYSVPLLSQSLLRYFSPEPYTLLVTHTPKINAQSTHGLRQSFFVQQSFQLSRLIPVTLEYSQAYAKMIIDQIIKTQYYLNSTRLLPSTTPLSVFILLPPPLLHVVHDFVNKYPHPDLYIHCIDIHELAQQFDFQSDNQLLYLHDLVAYHLVHITPNNHYAKSEERKYDNYRKLRLGMYTFSAMILATSIINTAMELYDASTTYQKVHTTKMLIEQRRKALREKRPPNLPMQVEYIHGIVDAGHYFENRYKMPRQTWENISQIFVQHTHLKLKSLNWKVKYKNTLNEQAQTIDNQKSKMTQRFFEVVTLEGEVIDFRGDYIQATLLVRRFLEALRQKKQLFYQVKEILTPFEANRQQLLRGQLENSDTTNLATIKYRAPFTIEILVEHHGKTK